MTRSQRAADPACEVAPGDPEGPLRVGLVSAFPPGRNSLNEFGFHLARHLAASDEVASLTLFADRTAAGAPAPVDGMVALPCWEFNHLANVVSIVRAVRAARTDGVIFNLQFATFGDRRVPGAFGLFAPAITSKLGIPTIVVLHNLADNVDMRDAGFAGSRVMARIMSLAGRALTKVLLRSDLVALTIPRYVEFLVSAYGATNAVLVPHGAFEDVSEPSFGVPDGTRRILAFGKWGTYKTVDVLVDAYRDLLDRGYTDVELVVAGTDSPNSPGYLAGVQEGCADLPGVTFTGYVAEEDVAGLFGGSALVAFPYTSTTGSSGVLHQAGTYGRAAVLPLIGDFVEVIEEEGFTGEYFTPADATSLADAMAKLLDDPGRAEEIGRRNFAAAAGIPMSEVVDWHVLHLRSLLADRGRPRR